MGMTCFCARFTDVSRASLGLLVAVGLLMAAPMPARADDSQPEVPRAAAPHAAAPHLQVVRTPEAMSCPDAPQLAARVAGAIGGEAFDLGSTGAASPGFDVVFARLESGYLATVRHDGQEPATRTARTVSAASCGELTEAVVVALALMLDDRAAAALVTPPPPAPLPVPILVERAEIPPPPEPPPPPYRHWYGAQTLVLDAIGAGLVVIGGSLSSESHVAAQQGFVAVGLTTFALGPPIVHIAHGRWKIGLADFGIRVGSVVSTGFIGAMIGASQTQSQTVGLACGTANSCSDSIAEPSGDPALVGMLVGASIGAVAASLLDAAVFARENVNRPVDTTTAGVSWSPTVIPLAHGATAGFVGRF